MNKDSRPRMNSDNSELYKIIKLFIIEDQKKVMTHNKLLREVFLTYMMVHKIRTNIPEHELKAFELQRDLYLARTNKNKEHQAPKTIKR
jgi:hypothetical protein